MRNLLLLSTLLFITFSAVAQKKLERTLKQLNSESVPYIYVNELQTADNKVLLDTRKREEYEVSHLKGALWVGYKNFKKDSLLKRIADKDTPIVVYCSIGVRSEDIGEKLQKAGFTNVQNLYGGIFEWKNQGNEVYHKEMKTDSVHTFNKQWGKLLNSGIKVYGNEKGH